MVNKSKFSEIFSTSSSLLLPAPIFFCVNSDMYSQHHIEAKFFPKEMRPFIMFLEVARPCIQKIDFLFNILCQELGNKKSYEFFLRKCKNHQRFGPVNQIEPCSIPNLNTFFELYSRMGKIGKKEILQRLHAKTQGDISAILAECYQNGLKIKKKSFDPQDSSRLKDCSLSIFQRIERVISPKTDEKEGRESLKETIQSQNNDTRQTQQTFRK